MILNHAGEVVMSVLGERQGAVTNAQEDAVSIILDTSSIPALRRDELLEAMTAPLTAFYADPENQKKFEAWLAKRRAAGKE